MVRPGRIIRERRLANGLSQAQLAIRAGSTQAAISRLERGELSPTFETFERLLSVMGETADLVVRREPAGVNLARLVALRVRSPAERVALASGFNHLAGRFAAEGRRVKAGPG